jgi:hypothetical protein
VILIAHIRRSDGSTGVERGIRSIRLTERQQRPKNERLELRQHDQPFIRVDCNATAGLRDAMLEQYGSETVAPILQI